MKIGRTELIFAIIACAIFAWIAGFTHFFMIDRHAALDIARYHQAVLAGAAESPMQYRPGAYLIADMIGRGFHTDIVEAYKLERIAFVFAAGFISFLFFRRFLPTGWAFAGIGWFFAIMPFTYIGYTHQPADPVNAAFHALAFLAAASGGGLWIIPISATDAFFRETAILIPFFYLITDYGRRPLDSVIARFVAALIATGFIIFLVRMFYGTASHPDPMLMAGYNIKDLRWVWYLIILAGFPVAMAFSGWRDVHPFLKRGLLFVLIFTVFMFLFGRFGETRLMLPVIPLLIAAGLDGLRNRTEVATDG